MVSQSALSSVTQIVQSAETVNKKVDEQLSGASSVYAACSMTTQVFAESGIGAGVGVGVGSALPLAARRTVTVRTGR